MRCCSWKWCKGYGLEYRYSMQFWNIMGILLLPNHLAIYLLPFPNIVSFRMLQFWSCTKQVVLWEPCLHTKTCTHGLKTVPISTWNVIYNTKELGSHALFCLFPKQRACHLASLSPCVSVPWFNAFSHPLFFFGHDGMTCHNDDFLSFFGCMLLAYTNLLPTVFFPGLWSAFLKWMVL